MARSSRRFATTIISALSALALCAGLTACSSSPDIDRTITVTTSSRVKAVPDVARISLTIASEGDDATLAKNANEKPTKEVLAALDKLGVTKEDIQTTYTDLSPIWDENGQTDRYQMRTALSVGGLAIDEVATVVDACVEAGATEVSGPEYYVSDYDERYEEALAAAIEKGRTKAEAMAQASGTSLTNIVSVSEGYQDTSIAYAKSTAMTEDAALEAGGMADIEPGTVEIAAEVTISYGIR